MVSGYSDCRFEYGDGICYHWLPEAFTTGLSFYSSVLCVPSDLALRYTEELLGEESIVEHIYHITKQFRVNNFLIKPMNPSCFVVFPPQPPSKLVSRQPICTELH